MGEKLAKLKERAELVWNLYGLRSLTGWDHQVMMPSGGGPARANQMAALERVAHELLVSDELRNALEGAEKEVAGRDPDDLDLCYVKAVRRKYDRYAKVPAELVEEMARTTTLAMEAWVTAKKTNDFPLFQPHLERVMDLCRRIAEARGYAEHPYDAMLDEWESGMKASQLKRLFDGLKPGLVDLVKRIRDQEVPPSKILQQRFPAEGQRKFNQLLLPAIGFDVRCGRLDESAHPFCASPSSLDVRLTNRVYEDQLPASVFGTLHEAGHGLYEQGSPAEFNGTPLKGGCSLGVHESQSRLWENLVGRSRAFWRYHYGHLVAHFPDQLSGYTAEDFYRAINEVKTSFIRVEADEVTYTLHIIMRFELELELLEGKLAVEDVPEAWNSRFESYFGIRPPTDTQGCLQDIHWSDGLVGYFPTYSLGNMIASQLWERIQRDIPDLEQQIESGDCRPLLAWLREHVHRHASKYEPTELVCRATGQDLAWEPFLSYLEKKYGEIYGLIPAIA